MAELEGKGKVGRQEKSEAQLSYCRRRLFRSIV